VIKQACFSGSVKVLRLSYNPFTLLQSKNQIDQHATVVFWKSPGYIKKLKTQCFMWLCGEGFPD